MDERGRSKDLRFTDCILSPEMSNVVISSLIQRGLMADLFKKQFSPVDARVSADRLMELWLDSSIKFCPMTVLLS